MTDRTPSKTAIGVALMRAAHMVIDGEPKILNDTIAVPLLGPWADRIAADRERYMSEGGLRLRAHVVLRSRYAEDCLAEAVARGVRQFVVLGAGLDTFAYRQPAWASDIRVFEIDQPASQGAKRDLLQRAGIVIPSNVTLGPIDFETESLESGLRRHGVDLTQPVFFAWLGVSMYLTEDAVDAVLRFVASLARNTEMVLTFAPEAARHAGADGTGSLAAGAAAVGEPWLTYYDPVDLASKLGRLGFDPVSFLRAREVEERYWRGRTDQLPAPKRVSICRIRR